MNRSGDGPLMFRLFARLCLGALFAALVAATAFTAWAAGRLSLHGGHVDWRSEARSRLEPMLAVCFAAAGAGAALQWLSWRGRRRLLAEVELHLARLGDDPSANPGGLASADLAGVRAAAEALA